MSQHAWGSKVPFVMLLYVGVVGPEYLLLPWSMEELGEVEE
jgi:hypothetical protein